MREKYANYNRIGQTWEQLGDSVKAREAYDKARSIIERLAADEPGNLQWQGDLAVSHVNIGDMLRQQGNQAKALEEYREALNIRKRLAAEDPDNAKWQQTLASVHFRSWLTTDEPGRCRRSAQGTPERLRDR
jgi:tetratricopeptide (TPR) repeat protein